MASAAWSILCLVAALVLAGPTQAGPCLFEDGGAGFSTTAELGLPSFEEQQILAHILANEFVPTQNIRVGDGGLCS